MKNKRCYIEISIDNLRKNVRELKKYLPDNQQIIAVVKCDYYGHGAIVLANELQKMGIKQFAVATIDEAIQLRDNGISTDIMVLGYVGQDYWLTAGEKKIMLSIGTVEQAKQMSDFCRKNNSELAVQVQVDTGMHRNGLPYDISAQDLKVIYNDPYLHVKGTYSHLCTADSFSSNSKANTYRQKANFDYFLSTVKDLNLAVGQTHLCASSGIMNYPEFCYDCVRVGFMLLGFDVGEVKNVFERYPLLSWYSQVCSVRTAEKGQSISYGHTYTCSKKMKIATISVGYGDGYPRCLSNKGYVLIRGKRAAILGRICMDQMMVDVSEIDNVQPEDRVTLIGRDGDVSITANELAQMADTIVDEIVCSINKRVARYYIKQEDI
ncbi:MAG: alanine racemase [Erysipelotrichia bacterium]|nr:alanine racemase [Erysipelotrichia bacterium]